MLNHSTPKILIKIAKKIKKGPKVNQLSLMNVKFLEQSEVVNDVQLAKYLRSEKCTRSGQNNVEDTILLFVSMIEIERFLLVRLDFQGKRCISLTT